MSNIYERIGEALLSNGKYDIIRAENKHEEDVLANAGFTKVGSIKEGDKIIALFKIEHKTKEVLKIVEAPNKNNSWPFGEQSHPFRKPDPGIWYYNNHWMINNPNNPMYTYLGTGTGNSDWMMTDMSKTTSVSNTTSNSSGSNPLEGKSFNGTLSTRLDSAAHNPLGVLEDYFFPTDKAEK